VEIWGRHTNLRPKTQPPPYCLAHFPSKRSLPAICVEGLPAIRVLARLWRGGRRSRKAVIRDPSSTPVPSLKNLIFLMLVHYISTYAYTYILSAASPLFCFKAQPLISKGKNSKRCNLLGLKKEAHSVRDSADKAMTFWRSVLREKGFAEECKPSKFLCVPLCSLWLTKNLPKKIRV